MKNNANVISIRSITHEEVVVDSSTIKMYLAGKHTWEPVTIVLRDDMNPTFQALGPQLNKQVDSDQTSYS